MPAKPQTRLVIAAAVPLGALLLTATSVRLDAQTAPLVHPRAATSPVRQPELAGPLQVASDSTKALAVASTSGAGDLPGPALAAYQRAAQVIDAAAPTCHLRWSLLAGIGGVVSDHGRRGAEAGATEGPDTDGGRIDGDPTKDLPVGPMRLSPSAWRTIAVDADGDGHRDPQDLDDAALAAAILLCGSKTDLGAPAGEQTALAEYDPAPGFAAAVLDLAARYETVQYAAPTALPTPIPVQLPTTATDTSVETVAATTKPPATAALTTHSSSAAAPQTPTDTVPARPTTEDPTPAADPCPTPTLEAADDPTPTVDPATAPDPACETESAAPIPSPSPTTDPSPEPSAEPTPEADPIAGSAG